MSSLTECAVPLYCASRQVPAFCDEEIEHEWLIDLYRSTNGDEWQNNTNWVSNTTHHCHWHGVYCCYILNNNSTSLIDNTTLISNFEISDMKVTKCINGIVMNSNNLNGQLPNYWPNSTAFNFLEFEYNNLIGTLPDYSQQLPNLIDISFPHNQLNGTIPPFPVSNCLSFFTIDDNKLSGNIPDWSNLYNLTYVVLSSNFLKGTIPDWSKWHAPYYVELGLTPTATNNEITGTIPDWSAWKSYSLSGLKLSYLNLYGTVPNLPKFARWVAIHENVHYETRLGLTGNKLKHSTNVLSFREVVNTMHNTKR